MRAAADSLCDRGESSREPCHAYHRAQLYLRMIGARRGILGDAPFMMDAFRSAAREGASRVLISGTAEYGIMAVLLHAYELEDVTPSVTVIDLCETPLAVCRWYAERKGIEIETAACDILKFEADAPFDVVASHFFVGRFRPDDRVTVARRWYDSLGPKGLAITAQRIHPDIPGGIQTYEPDEIARCVKRVLQAAKDFEEGLAVAPEAIASDIEDYLASTRRSRIGTPEEMWEPFERAGFVRETFDSLSALGEYRDRSLLPRRGRTDVVRLIARRPE